MVEVTQEGADIFSFKLFSADFCREVVARLAHSPHWADAGVYYHSPRTRAVPKFRAAKECRLWDFPFLARAYKKFLPSIVYPAVLLAWRRPTDDLSTESIVVRYDPGGHFDLHYDANAFRPLRLLSLICYFNADFAGGTTRFPRQNVEISPLAGRAVLFPSGITHPHQAMPVKKGRKYVLTSWLCQRRVRG